MPLSQSSRKGIVTLHHFNLNHIVLFGKTHLFHVYLKVFKHQESSIHKIFQIQQPIANKTTIDKLSYLKAQARLYKYIR